MANRWSCKRRPVLLLCVFVVTMSVISIGYTWFGGNMSDEGYSGEEYPHSSVHRDLDTKGDEYIFEKPEDNKPRKPIPLSVPIAPTPAGKGLHVVSSIFKDTECTPKGGPIKTDLSLHDRFENLQILRAECRESFTRPNPKMSLKNIDYVKSLNGESYTWMRHTGWSKPPWDGTNAYPSGVSFAGLFHEHFLWPDGIPYNNKNMFVTDHILCFEKNPKPDACLNPVAKEKVVEHVSLVSVVQQWHDEYYHFWSETMPKLVLLLPILKEDKDAVLLINNGKKYIKDVLEILDIPLERTVSHSMSIVRFAKRLYTASPTPCGAPPKQLVKELSSLFVPNPPSREEAQKVVVIKRTGMRQLDNHDKVMELIRSVGSKYNVSEVVEFVGDLSVRDTIDLFSHARIIVGPHGAGLVNMLFAPPGTAVVEVTPGKDVNMCYWHFSSAMELPYFLTVDKSASTYQGKTSMTANMDEMAVLLEEAFSVT